MCSFDLIVLGCLRFPDLVLGSLTLLSQLPWPCWLSFCDLNVAVSPTLLSQLPPPYCLGFPDLIVSASPTLLSHLPDLIVSASPTLLSRLPRPYCLGFPDLIVSASLCGTTAHHIPLQIIQSKYFFFHNLFIHPIARVLNIGVIYTYIHNTIFNSWSDSLQKHTLYSKQHDITQ